MKGFIMSEVFQRTEIHFVNTTFGPKPKTFMATLEEGTDLDGALDALSNMIRCGWEIGAVHFITDHDYSGEYTVADITSISEVVDVTEQLIDNNYSATRILAYGELYGWDVNGILSERYADAMYYEGDSPADIAMEMFYETHPDLMEEINGTIFLSIDWEHTAEQMRQNSAYFHKRNGITVMFDGI